MSINFPNVVSRTLDPSGKSLLTVVGLHDRQLSDADLNLIQSLQDSKRQKLVSNMATSGCLTYAPFQFVPSIDNTFLIPQFDVLFNGEVVTIAGHLSDDPTLNRVVIPQPTSWIAGQTSEPAAIYVVFLEMWYQNLDPSTGEGYLLDPFDSTQYFYYPYGCVNPDLNSAIAGPNAMPDDAIDIFDSGLQTTQRAQIQWRFNVQRVALTYDFTQYSFGLQPGARPTEIVYAQAQPQGGSTPIIDSGYTYWNQGDTSSSNPHFTGDTGLWAAGDVTQGTINSLNTLDGLSYALPMAIVCQKNTGNFNVQTNPFGCGNSSNASLSGRYDQKLATQIFAEDVVDTRQTVSLNGWDYEDLLRGGFVDVISGNCRLAISRGISPGMDSRALGSALDYYVSVAPSTSPVLNTDEIGQWDGYANGFSSDQRTFYVTQQVTKAGNNQTWVTGGFNPDTFNLSLPGQSSATISSAVVQAFNTQGNVKVPVTLQPGQITITGIGSKQITVTLSSPLTGTPFNPGANHLYVTLGVQYPAALSMNLRNSPIAIAGGTLSDTVSSKYLPVFGVSEYLTKTTPPVLQNALSGVSVSNVVSINPNYSNLIFGTRVTLSYSVAAGIAAGNIITQTVNKATTTTFVFDRTGAGYGIYSSPTGGQGINGLYVINCWDASTGTNIPYTITSQLLNGTNCLVTVSGAVTVGAQPMFTFLAQDTTQLVYNAPVGGVTAIEEVVLFGTYTSDPTLTMEQRIVKESVSLDSTGATPVTTMVFAANGCTIKGIAGNDVSKLIWVKDNVGNLNSVPVASANFTNGLVTVTINGDYYTSSPQFFFVGSILPALSPTSTLVLQERYVPYQGEGTTTHQYDVLLTGDSALITTNGTGKAPVVGLADVYPYNREIPISTTLPCQLAWKDATLTNAAVASFFDSNYEAMRQNNVEHTFEAPLHTNDFIPPMNKDTRKQVQLLSSGGGRGFSQATPHLGFAIRPLVSRTVLGQNLQATTAPIVLYVNNQNGSDNNDGLSLQTPKLTITAALNLLPPVLRHPCSIQLVDTKTPFSILSSASTLEVIALGDGVIRSSEYYALANLAFTMQESGRLVITTNRTAGATNRVTIDATGYVGDGTPTSAFFIDTTRVIFNGISFTGFQDPAIKGINSDIEFVDCNWQSNIQCGSFEQGCGVIVENGNITLPDGGTGFVMSSSELTVSGTTLGVVAGADSGAFFTGERQSTINLSNHGTSTLQETNIIATTVVAEVQLNSSVVVDPSFQTNGMADLAANSVLSRQVTVNPFAGGVTVDASSTTVTSL